VRFSFAFAWAFALLACEVAPAKPAVGAAQRRPAPALKIVESVYASGLAPGWSDFGWAPRDLDAGHPARVDFSALGGWIVAHPNLRGPFGGFAMRVRAPSDFGPFLEARVDSTHAEVFPRVQVGPTHAVEDKDGWAQVWIPMDQLNPNGSSFDRLILRAYRPVRPDRVELDTLGFTERPPQTTAAAHFDEAAFDVAMRADCMAPGHAISPAIYGIAFDPRLDETDTQQWALGATARRWGGNASSRYNWELGHAWNTANDWFFRNVNYTGLPNYSYANFFEDNAAHHLQTALTIPILGWVAKDTESASFPRAVFPSQRKWDPTQSEAGDGFSPDGKPLSAGAPSRTSAPTTPVTMGRWVSAIREQDAVHRTRSVQMYILDNEPMLWNSTHRDVHPDPVGYDELLERTLAYGSAVRKADPQGVIAGPAEWGWPAYFFSAIDTAAGFARKPDRRAHGNVPLLAWYLQQLKSHEDQTGERLLDVVDVHFYSQGKNLAIGAAGGTDPDTNARRLRGTRSLWDPSYVDESWIGEPIELIPRLRRLIQDSYPGRGISIGEYNFGAEQHITGGLALAEALGRFGQQGIDAAFYWTYPAQDSHAFWAFRAYRNFDGKGGHFLDESVPTSMAPGASLFASKDASGTHVVLVALNLDPRRALRAHIDLTTCGSVGQQRLFVDTADAPGLAPTSPGQVDKGALVTVLPPYSLTVMDLTLSKRGLH